jgi:hypothetical protein
MLGRLMRQEQPSERVAWAARLIYGEQVFSCRREQNNVVGVYKPRPQLSPEIN